jgi:hypothetical protein
MDAGSSPQHRVGLNAESLLEANRHVGGQAGPTIQESANCLAGDAEMASGVCDTEAVRLDNLSAQPDARVDSESGSDADSRQ